MTARDCTQSVYFERRHFQASKNLMYYGQYVMYRTAMFFLKYCLRLSFKFINSTGKCTVSSNDYLLKDTRTEKLSPPKSKTTATVSQWVIVLISFQLDDKHKKLKDGTKLLREYSKLHFSWVWLLFFYSTPRSWFFIYTSFVTVPWLLTEHQCFNFFCNFSSAIC